MAQSDPRAHGGRHKRRQFIDKPLLGFGPLGWTLLLVALALAACWWRGIDLRHKLYWYLTQTVGIEWVYWITTTWLPWAWFHLREPVFSPVALAYILVLCHLSPRPVAWWKYGLLGVWCFVVPALAMPVYKLGNTSGTASATAYMGLLDLIGTCAILFFIVRSWRIVAGAAAGMALARAGWVVFVELASAGTGGLGLVVLSWACVVTYHASVAAPLVCWVIASRRARGRPGEVCDACGYDLKGLSAGSEGTRCPECGELARCSASAAQTRQCG